jgi:hypothetical protein
MGRTSTSLSWPVQTNTRSATQRPLTARLLGSQQNLRKAAKLIGLNSYQLATAVRLYNALARTTTYATVYQLGSDALLARDRLADYTGFSLPDNQWQLEVQRWFETGLAKLQAYVVEYAANVADLGPYGSITEPSPATDPLDQAFYDMCFAQRIRNTGAYQSFSFLGLMIVICVGSTLILLSWIIEPIIACTRRRRRKNGNQKHDYREIVRIADQKLQLQRMALIGAGYRDGWEHPFDEVPVTTKGALFPPPTRLERGPAGPEDYCYGSAMSLLNWVGDGEEGTAVCMDPGMQEASVSPLPALSRPANFGAEESQRLLVPQGHGGPAPGNGQVQGQGSGTSEGSLNSVGPASDLWVAES